MIPINKSKYYNENNSSYGWSQFLGRIGLMIFLVSPIVSCMAVVGVFYGVHQPRYFSDSKVVHYAEQIGLQGDIYRLKDYTEQNRSKYRYLGKTLPETLIFNAAGQITQYEIDCSSDFDAMVLLSIESIDSLETGDKTLHEFIDDTYMIHSSENVDILESNTPVYVIKFAEFAGKLNKDHIPDQIRVLQSRDDVKYILLNMDYSERE